MTGAGECTARRSELSVKGAWTHEYCVGSPNGFAKTDSVKGLSGSEVQVPHALRTRSGDFTLYRQILK